MTPIAPTVKYAFTGHRPEKLGGYSPQVQAKLVAFAKSFLYPRKDMILLCYSGMALGWDQAVAEACVDLSIPFAAAIPFLGQESTWPESSQRHYHDLVKAAATVVYVCDEGFAGWKMQKRNEYMVDNCHALIGLWDGTPGGTANCIKYAVKKGVVNVNLWSDWSILP
jgi:uncharacterized phage-like protein YoqJ